MFRTAILSFSLFAAPALATSHYCADPAAKPAAGKIIVRDTLWRCNDGGCTGGKSNSRPAIVCAALAREVGELRSFSAGGEAFAAQQLQKCNASAN